MTELNAQQVESAVKALYAFVKGRAEAKQSLFEQDDDVSLIITLKKTPDKPRIKPHRIPLPHTLFGRDGVQICLITKDPYKEFKEILDKEPVANVSKVLGVSRLRKNYKQYQDKRTLLSSYDLFVADDRVLPLLPALLGKKFFEKKKHPVPVALSRKGNVQAELRAARDSTYFYLPSGPTCAVKVAKTQFTPQQVVENIVSGFNAIVEHIPKKWRNIQALHIKTHDSVALPIFNSLPLGKPKDTAEESVSGAAPATAVVAESKQQKPATKKRKQPSSAEPVASAAESVAESASAVISPQNTPAKTKGKRKQPEADTDQSGPSPSTRKTKSPAGKVTTPATPKTKTPQKSPANTNVSKSPKPSPTVKSAAGTPASSNKKQKKGSSKKS